MSQATSPSTEQRYGVVRVTRAWEDDAHDDVLSSRELTPYGTSEGTS